MYYLITMICGIVAGNFTSQYAFLLLKDEKKILSRSNIILSILHGLFWTGIVYCCGIDYVSVLYCVTASALLGLSIVDWCSYEIPIGYNILILVLGCIRLAMDIEHWPLYIIGMFLVSGIFFILLIATKGRGMGGGDVKLMFTCGLLLGWKKILLVMILGSILGALIHTIITKASREEHMLAFGPYLSGACIVAMCYGEQLIDLYTRYFMSGVQM